MSILNIFILGVIILAGAIILNYLASLFGLNSWYDFIKNSKQAGWVDYIWLFIIYPLGLGLIAYYASKIVNLN